MSMVSEMEKELAEALRSIRNWRDWDCDFMEDAMGRIETIADAALKQYNAQGEEEQ